MYLIKKAVSLQCIVIPQPFSQWADQNSTSTVEELLSLMYSADTNYFFLYSSPLIASNFGLLLNTESTVSDNFSQDLFWIPVMSWEFTLVTLQLTGFSCLSLWLCTADMPLPCHIMSCWQLSLCFLLRSTEFSYSSVQPSLFLTFLGDDLSFQISYKYMEVHRVPGNTHAPLFLSEKLPTDCHHFFPVYINLWTHRRTSPLTPWELIETKPIFQAKGKIHC